jgi:two-component system, OmpR family, alkaline phosphatase synthesis response regulator PhoP
MPKTVLLADDEAHITHVLGLKLGGAGYGVLVARDGEEAYELARRERPDLVITDFQMPRTDGYGLAMRLGEAPWGRSMPLIMLTARGHRLTREQVARTNIRLVLQKPFSAREVLEHVERMIGPSDEAPGRSGSSEAPPAPWPPPPDFEQGAAA